VQANIVQKQIDKSTMQKMLKRNNFVVDLLYRRNSSKHHFTE